MAEARSPRRGEIWYVDFDPARGSEQAGRRPALVIQNDAGNASHVYPNTIVLAMSTARRNGPLNVRVEAHRATGLRETTWVKCEQVLTISKFRLLGRGPLGRLDDETLRKVEVALLLSVGIGLPRDDGG
ncbi:type II toxin-antitoxin system PemK/MazF family toxin [Acidobacteria bacterium ACD]|nr:MAG: type II toxin-antitoxin system PemK/MazF family toxin [Acidobacteriota bacterium]MCE7957910.1 type II toxin-antitoxin system PemK/MazF family toxin [Acidobacteria bacterium ACB2]MDL1950738.1 type II toxin-antitoxin system PemK/MazF family toxin [Acidobacteria bacterium ACD]